LQTSGGERKVWALTGAAGRIASVLREGLAEDVSELRCLDLRPVGLLRPHERSYQLDLADRDGMAAAFDGCEGVLHLGGYPGEADFHDLVAVNIVGTYHVLDAARLAGARRVVYASSNRITGFYPITTLVNVEMPVRPDGLYGVSKAACEALCRVYSDKFGLSTVSVRIGSFPEEPRDVRDLSTWLSRNDVVRAFRAAMSAPDVSCATFYAVSNNAHVYWDARAGRELGYEPVDSAETYAERFASLPARSPSAPQSREEQTSQEHTLSLQRTR
jgi:uronate dehydrogenase